MSPAPRRVRTPSWFDVRLILGVALVLGSIVLGAVVLSRADSTRPVLAVTHDLDSGYTLKDSDVRTVRVRLSGSSAVYIDKASDAVGKVLQRALGDGDLLPATAVGNSRTDLSTVAIKVDPSTSPSIERGQRIAVYITTQYCPAGVLLIKDVTVQDVRKPGTGGLSSTSDQSVIVQVPTASANQVISGTGLSQVAVSVAVLTGPRESTNPAEVQIGDPSSCSAPAK